MDTESPTKYKNIKKILRKLFFLFRVIILLIVLGLVSAFIYINTIGVPQAIKNAIIEQLESPEIQVSFSSIRFEWFKGIVVDNVFVLGRSVQTKSFLKFESLEISPEFKDLTKFRFKIAKIVFTNGKLSIVPNEESKFDNFEDLNGIIRINEDLLIIPHLTAKYKNIKITSSFDIDRHQKKQTYPTIHGKNRIESLSTNLLGYLRYLDGWSFATNSNLEFKMYPSTYRQGVRIEFTFQSDMVSNQNLTLRRFDAKLTDFSYFNKNMKGKIEITAANYEAGTNSFDNIELKLFADVITNGVRELKAVFNTKKGTGKFGVIQGLSGNATYSGEPFYLTTNETKKIDITLLCKTFTNADLLANQLNIKAKAAIKLFFNEPAQTVLNVKCANIKYLDTVLKNISCEFNGDVLISGHYKGKVVLSSPDVRHKDIIALNVSYQGQIKNNENNPYPRIIIGKLACDSLKIDDNIIKDVDAEVSEKKVSVSLLYLNIQGLLTNYDVKLNATVEKVKTNIFNVRGGYIETELNGNMLFVKKLHLKTDSGKIDINGGVNLDSKDIALNINSLIDLKEISKYSSPTVSNILEEIKPDTVPLINLTVQGKLPLMTNSLSTLNIFSNLYISGDAQLTNVSYKTIDVSSLKAKFDFSNSVLNVKDLKLISVSNIFNCKAVHNLKTRDIKTDFYCLIEPHIIEKFIPSITSYLKLIETTVPIEFSGSFSGNSTNIENGIINGSFSATNFSFRGKHIIELRSGFDYANKVLSFSDFELIRTNEQARGQKIIADFNQERVYLKSVWGNLNPDDLSEAIGEKVHKAISKVKFSIAPSVSAGGSVPMHGAIGDIRFNIYAPDIKWWKLNPKKVTCTVYWKDETMLITNCQSEFYYGNMSITLFTDFSKKSSNSLYYDVVLTNVNSKSLLKDILLKPKNVEGKLSGNLSISSPSIDDYQKWSGKGKIELVDGLIWDIPIFGIFSPILNMVTPGLGNSRANFASASFIVTNGLVVSSDLEIRARVLRMQYEGSIGFDKSVNARVEAELLSEVWLLGPALKILLKPLTKLFIYKVSGTIDKPEMEPVYIPRILLFPFHPFKTLKNLVIPKSAEEDKEKNNNRVTPLPENNQ